MADFNGKFQYLTSNGSVAQEGACQVQFDRQNFTLAPESGQPLVADLGDINAIAAANYEIKLPLYTGNTIVLRQFGKAYETLSHDLLEAHRQRTLECLLLEDLEEVARFNGNFGLDPAGAAPRSGAAEFRLFQSNLAVLPAESQGFQWRLTDVDSVTFDEGSYEVILRSGQDVLRAGKLGKRTEEFLAGVKQAIADLATRSTQALHSTFPFLDPDQLQAVSSLLREGHAAPVAKLAAIHPGLPAALADNAVDSDLKPYYDDLLAKTPKDALYAGFKLIRAEDSDSENETPGPASLPDGDSAGPQMLYWFYFPVGGNIVAWEASSAGGRATYFFRPAEATLEAALRKLDHVLGMLNFRRRPIYLSDDELERDPKFHRYAIAARRIPELREVRAAFVGRAIHSSLDAWQEQVKGILKKAGVA